VGSLFLYGLFKLGGLPMLFAMRYVLLATALALLWWVGFKVRQGKKTTTWLILTVYLLASMPGTFLKPEMFSLLFFAVMAVVYFSVKLGLWEKQRGRAFFLLPILFLLWANTHGVFVFGLVILGIIACGEAINAWRNVSTALDKRTLHCLLVAAFLSGLASLITPYGLDYLIQTATGFIQGDEALKTVAAYLNVFDARLRLTHAGQFWIFMLACTVGVFGYYYFRHRSIDWALLILNGFLCWLAAQFHRSSFFWTPFWALSMIYMLHKIEWPNKYPKVRHVVQLCVVIGCLFLSGRAVYEVAYRPFATRYLGFGIGYFNPVQASAFVKTNRPGNRMYNSYNTGGYLLWDLYPDQKVFFDARYFPFADWFEEYYAFNDGNTPIDEFHSKYPFDFAVVDYISSESPIIKFLLSDKWQPVFYGPVAMVFVPSDSAFEHDYRSDGPQRFDDVRNLFQARLCFYMALNLEDPKTSRYVLEMMKRRFSRHYGTDIVIANCTRMQEGIEAYHAGQYGKALEHLGNLDLEMTPKISLALVRLRNWQCKEYIKQGRLQDALQQLKYLLELQPLYADALYNAGVIAYQVESQRLSKNDQKSSRLSPRMGNLAEQINESQWRNYLIRLLKIQPDHRHAHIARQLLEGKGLSGQVPLAL
jgi:tetratricopeptide (TPR) repeat protein